MLTGMVLVLVCALVGAMSVDLMARVVKAGIAAEAIASVGIGLALLLVFREQDFSIFTETLGAEALSGGSTAAALLAALAVGGWVFIGFDACVGASEETRDAARHVPRAIWIALLSVGGAGDPQRGGRDARASRAGRRGGRRGRRSRSPPRWSPRSARGRPSRSPPWSSWRSSPAASPRRRSPPAPIYSIARDDVLPASAFLRRVDRRKAPIGAIAVTAVVACLGLLLGLEAAAVGSLIAFGTAAIYLSFLLTALAALIARLRGTWRRAQGSCVNVLAVAWLAFETVNIAWPRESLAPPDAPFYQVWAAPIVLVSHRGGRVWLPGRREAPPEDRRRT